MKLIVYSPSNGKATVTESRGKFLQLVLDGQEYLLFSPAGLDGYHNQILARFLTERGIPHRWSAAATLEVEHPGLRILGGGRYRVDTEAGRLELWDDSQAYGRFQERGLAQKIAGAQHPWSEFRLRIA